MYLNTAFEKSSESNRIFYESLTHRNIQHNGMIRAKGNYNENKKKKINAIYEAKHLRSQNVLIKLKLTDYIKYELTTLRAKVQEKNSSVFVFLFL